MKDELSAPAQKKISRLDIKVQSLLELICDLKAMEECVLEMKFDTKKAPLGMYLGWDKISEQEHIMACLVRVLFVCVYLILWSFAPPVLSRGKMSMCFEYHRGQILLLHTAVPMAKKELLCYRFCSSTSLDVEMTVKCSKLQCCSMAVALLQVN